MKEYPTLDKLLRAIKLKGYFEGKQISLWDFIKNIGFQYKRLMITTIYK